MEKDIIVERLESMIGTEVTVRTPEDESMKGTLRKLEEKYFVGKNPEPLRPEEIEEISGTNLTLYPEDEEGYTEGQSNFFGGVLN